MTINQTKTFSRVLTLEAGTAMVVTDLHGDWDAYERYRDRFISLRAAGQADYFILTGDLIHAEDPDKDSSLEVVLDVMALQATYGSSIIYLCGNHELPHIYNINLSRGDRAYTPEFEKTLSATNWRPKIVELFQSLPFYIRTRAGVCLTHAGAPPHIVEQENGQKLFRWSHASILEWAEETLRHENIAAMRRGYSNLHHGMPYDTLVRYYLSVTDSEDSRYDDLLRGYIASNHPDFNKVLWPALFTRCEEEYGMTDHKIFVEALLQELSVDFTRQQFLITGHMTIKGGYHTVAKQHLRLASARHATPRSAGQYLLFDTGRPIDSMKELLKGLGSVFD